MLDFRKGIFSNFLRKFQEKAIPPRRMAVELVCTGLYWHIRVLVSKTFFSRTCHILSSNFSRTWIRDASGAVPCYDWQKDHVPMPVWLTAGQRDDFGFKFGTTPKSQQLHTDWTAHFSVCGHWPHWGLQLLEYADCHCFHLCLTHFNLCFTR